MEIEKLIKDNVVFWCDTEEKANELLKKANELGYTWCTGTSYLNDNNWKKYKKYTCYNIEEGSFADRYFYTVDNYKIIEYKLDIEKDNIDIKSLSKQTLEIQSLLGMSLEEIIKQIKQGYKFLQEKEILNKVEKEYLKSVINPFRNKIISIQKLLHDNDDFEMIIFYYKAVNGNKLITNLPIFEKNSMYKNMEINKKYTLEELGI